MSPILLILFVSLPLTFVGFTYPMVDDTSSLVVNWIVWSIEIYSRF